LSGTGTVSAEPDQGYITVGVQTKAETSSEAVSQNSKLMTNLFTTLTAFGVEKKDFRTTQFSLNQNYKRVQFPLENGKYETRSVADGFIVVNQVRVTVCDLKNMGDVLDALVKSGANRVQSISFGSSEAQKHLDKARKKAVEDVKRKAGILTEALGVELGRIVNVSESSHQPRREVYRAQIASAAADSVPVSGGSLSFNINVSVVWELKQEGKAVSLLRKGKEIIGGK
jgi:uncharacterized protein YggE